MRTIKYNSKLSEDEGYLIRFAVGLNEQGNEVVVGPCGNDIELQKEVLRSGYACRFDEYKVLVPRPGQSKKNELAGTKAA